MPSHRIDTLSRILASRRATLRGTLAFGIGTMLAAPAASATAGQDAAAVATPAIDPNDPHPGADSATVKPEFLFVQPFASGTWAPKDGADGTYTLTLSGAAAQTAYFSDRPERIVGLSPMQDFLDGLGFTPANPPNAALVAGADGEQDILVIELLNPVWDGISALTYDARVLADYGDTGLANLARQQADYEFPASFADGGLFIDGCPDGVATCYTESNDQRTIVGEIWSVGCHWTSEGCQLDYSNPGADTYGKLCHETFPDTCEYQQANGQTIWNCYAEDVICRAPS